MNLKTIKSKLIQVHKNAFGWRTNRKIVVFESDDWGSIRMPSIEAFNHFKKKGIPVEGHRYSMFDTLADENDLSLLFDVLCTVKDKNGSYAKFTPLSLVANPDFEKIKASGFQKYYYEPFTETLRKYGVKHQNAFNLWKEGVDKGIFKPQFHGREHLNVYMWLKALQARSPEALLAFNFSTFGLPADSFTGRKRHYVSAFEFYSEEEYSEMSEIIRDGGRLFEKIFGYKPMAFMAPCAVWSRRLEPVLKEIGVKVIQSGPVQYEPFVGAPLNKVKKIIRYTGQKNLSGQIFSVRNCSFEPSADPTKDWVDSCMNHIQMAFSWKKPAIISPHRINFIGSLVPENRTTGLKKLERLLKSIVKKWPDVEFLSSDELGQLMLHNKK